MVESPNHDRGLDLPIVKESEEMGEQGLRIVANAVAQTGDIFRPTEKRDFGIDGQIEIVVIGVDNRHASGRFGSGADQSVGPSYLVHQG
jgi:hypothetical protein